MFSKRTMTATLTTALAAAAVTLAAPPEAEACGGLFCSGGGPQQVNQAAERIIFSKNGDGTITAIVQIMYQGPTDRFGWVLPIPGVPEVGLSSDSAFTALQAATNPLYTMNTTVEGECKSSGGGGGILGAASDSSAESASNNVDNSPRGVEVLDQGSAGPYDYTVIQVDSQVDNNVQLALDWLDENNYEVTNVGPELLKPYLDDGNNLLAIRLQKNSDTGAIRPIRLTFEDTHPMVPIKLTAVAANDDMGVLAWVLGESRAIPKNYKHLEINDALINWFNPTATYNDVISVAANEASGQGFVTEYAQPTGQLNANIYTDTDVANWARIQNGNWEGNELRLIDEVIQTYAQGNFDNFGNPIVWDGLDEAIDQSFPTATTETKDQIEQCGSCAFSGSVPEDFSIETFIMAVEDFIVAPVRDTQKLFDEQPYVTRLYSTLSAAEMTLDPSFDFNPDLPNVSNQHTAERIIECHSSVTRGEAPWRAELPSGLVVRGEGNGWPFNPNLDEDFPATLEIREIGTTGDGEIVRDNARTVRMALDEHNASIPEPGAGGCSTTGSGADGSALLVLLGFFGFAARRRRG